LQFARLSAKLPRPVPYAESSLVARVWRSSTRSFTNSSMCWYAESLLQVVDLLVPLFILLVCSRAVYITHYLTFLT